MNRIKICLICFSLLMFMGCDPQFNYSFNGTIIKKEDNLPLDDVKISFKYFPIENINHWRANLMKNDTIQYTDEIGQFKNSFSTLTMAIDCVVVDIYKEGYKDIKFISTEKQWKSSFGFNQKTKLCHFGIISLEKK